MKFDHILIRYGELTLKTKNRKMFVHALRNRMRKALESFDIQIKANRDRAYIVLNDEDPHEIIDKLMNISGILSMSPVVKLEKTDEAMEETALKFANEIEAGKTFKIEVKRADKQYHLDTFGVQQLLGGYVMTHT